MKRVDCKLFNEESFVDEEILHVDLDMEKKSISLEMDGGVLNTGDFLEKTKIIIENWDRLEVMERKDFEYMKKIKIPDEFLSSIIEFHYSEDRLKLIGLGYDCWVEWVFSRPEVNIYVE